MNRCVVAVVDDIFFAAKIRAAAEHLGVDVRFAKTSEALTQLAREVAPSLVIFDLHSQKHDSFALAGELKHDENLRHIRLIGFYSHVQTELRQQAEAAGFDQVMPRSAFTRQLADILEGKDHRA